MGITFKNAEQKSEEVFTELVKGIREMIGNRLDDFYDILSSKSFISKQFLKEVLEKIDEIRSKLISFPPNEVENRFVLFLENELGVSKNFLLLQKNRPRILDAKEPQNKAIIDLETWAMKKGPEEFKIRIGKEIIEEGRLEEELKIWEIIATLTKFIKYANQESLGGLRKVLEKPESDIDKLAAKFETASKTEIGNRPWW